MAKPQELGGYDGEVTAACERVLVTVLSGLGPWKESVYLVGGLVPRYVVKARPPEVPPHAGTADVDIVVDLALLADTAAYETLEENLKRLGFERAENARGQVVNWRWKIKAETGVVLVLEFLADDPELGGGRVQELPTKGNISALNIPHAAMVFDLHDKVEITAELLGGGGRITQVVAHANLVSFCCLKAFAFAQRHELKDAHDLVYCLEHSEGGPDAAITLFRSALEGKHAAAIGQALVLLENHFCDPKPEEAYLRDGPVAVARFEISGDDGEAQEARILRQRRVADHMGDVIRALKLGGGA
ncbi:antitoxin [Bosea sp. (in: a-proteobacteria)]|uniref:antitoxin n=1 Tax=Bosea sp. (in: a-proteobacteria) TaxID=1871050 RepID=UPI00122A3763|nr:antitoxin [Bosea sp. (in: a-proteobacteria)]TAJ33643.1 MAG: antitoxin [Bosea sp. (in: a-proteobacteria)]